MKILYYDNDVVRVVVENAGDEKDIHILDDKIIYKDGFIQISGKSHYVIVDDNVSPESITQEQILDFYKKVKIDELNAKCEQSILNGFWSQTTGHFYRFNAYDQLNFTQKHSILLRKPDELTVDWNTEDAGVVTHTREEFFAVCDEAEQHKISNIEKYWTLKNQVLNATSREEIDSITW